MQASSAIRSQ